VVVSKIFLIFLPCPGGGHASSRVELFMPEVVQMSRSTPVFSSNTAYGVSSSEAVLRNVLIFSLQFPAGDMQHLQRAAARSISLGFGSTTQGYVSLFFSFNLHYLSVPSEKFRRKELSQIFALIPGGGHATYRAELFMPIMPMWISTTARLKATLLSAM
jgi:hypothetical protein